MANLLVLDPSMGKIWPNEHSYGYPLTKSTAISLYYDYINHLVIRHLSTRLTAHPTTTTVHTYTYIHTYIHTYMYMHMYIYIYIYIYINMLTY